MPAKTLPSSSRSNPGEPQSENPSRPRRGAPLGNRNAAHIRQLIRAAAGVDDFDARFDLLRLLCLATGALPRRYP